MYKVSPHPMFDVSGSRPFLFHTATYVIYIALLFLIYKNGITMWILSDDLRF